MLEMELMDNVRLHSKGAIIGVDEHETAFLSSE